MDWYTGYGMCDLLSQTECAAHAVFGIATNDGGYAVAGKYKTSTMAGERGDQGGFVLKQMGDPRLLGISSKQSGENAMLDTNPYAYSDVIGTDYSPKARNTTWVAKWNSPTHHDGGNTVAEVGSDLFVGGFKYSSAANAILPVIMKFDPSLGKSALKWEVLLPIPTLSPTLAPTPGVTDPPEPTEAPTVRNGAVEVCQATADGGLVCAGVTNYAADNWVHGFRSYGNPTDGDMFVVKYSAAHLAGAAAPTTPTWYKLFPNLISGKGIRELPASGGGGYIIGAHTNPIYLDATATYLRYAVLVKLDANGTMLWSKQYDAHGKVTDIALLTDGSLALTGHKLVGTGFDGIISKFTANGTFIWQSIVGNPVGGIHQFANATTAGNPTLIYGAICATRLPCTSFCSLCLLRASAISLDRSSLCA